MNRAQFTCGDAEIDKWFRNKAQRDHTSGKHIVTCVSFEDDLERVIGFYALSSCVEDAKKLPNVSHVSALGSSAHFPCIQLVYMAMHRDFQRKPEQYGSQVLAEIVRLFVDVAAAIAMPAMILTPINDDARRLYRRFGFEPYDHNMRMFLGLRQAREALNAAEAELEAEEGGGD